jgi:hypothetical protein
MNTGRSCCSVDWSRTYWRDTSYRAGIRSGHGGGGGACHPAQGLSECGGAAPLRSGGWGFFAAAGGCGIGFWIARRPPAAAVAAVACGIEVVAAGLLESLGVASAAGCLAWAGAQPCKS